MMAPDEVARSEKGYDRYMSFLQNYQGVWYPEPFVPGADTFRKEFKPRDTDILLVSPMKSGTTWLKALTFAMLNRKQHNPLSPDHPLTRTNPHDCIPFVDELFANGNPYHDSGYDVNDDELLRRQPSPPPRLLACHMPYSLLPESVTNDRGSDCRIVYICRDPKDAFVSGWYFINTAKFLAAKEPINELFEFFCDGTWPFGAVWEHCLGYWKESLRRPAKILFLKYEELMEDTAGNVKRLAEFIGCPFAQEEELELGTVEAIVKLCSSCEDTIKGTRGAANIKNSSYFRKGVVGDWKNHLTAEMAERLDAITKQKLLGSGLTF